MVCSSVEKAETVETGDMSTARILIRAREEGDRFESLHALCGRHVTRDAFFSSFIFLKPEMMDPPLGQASPKRWSGF